MALLFIDGYPFDLVISKGASYPGEVAEHPVDADADITDHIRNKPLELTLECVVSDTPTGEVATHPTRTGVGENALHGEAAFDKLLEIRGRKRPVTVETAKRSYDNMGLLMLERQETVESTGGAMFTVTFRQMNILANKRVTVRVAAPMVKAKNKVGTKQPKPKPKSSKLVERRVDPYDGTWFDPDINAWREGASFNSKTGHWEYFKGKPLGEDMPRDLTDADYRRIVDQRNAALVNVPAKGGTPYLNPGTTILFPGQF